MPTTSGCCRSRRSSARRSRGPPKSNRCRACSTDQLRLGLDRKHRSEPPAGRSKICRLPLIEARGGEQGPPLISIEPDIRLAPLRHSIELNHALAGRSEVLSDIAAAHDLGPHPLGHLVAAIDRLAAMAAERLEEQHSPILPKLLRIVGGNDHRAW